MRELLGADVTWEETFIIQMYSHVINKSTFPWEFLVAYVASKILFLSVP